MSERVLLHVGTPKSGTSYLQDVLFRNQKVLAGHGILYPADRFDAHFLAALDLMKLPWGGLESEAIGAWERLAAQVRGHRGTAVISHEILATASRQQVGHALESLGHGTGTEVHLVVSARDLARQIPAEWQENVKHRSVISYRRFLDQVRDPARTGRIATWFWGVQELPDILDRWGHALPPEHVHVVTVPPPGSDPDLLWHRFSRVFGLDGLDLDLVADRANPSLGVPETALLRRLNQRVNPVVDPPDYRPLVRELLAHQTLSQRRGSPRLTLPDELRPWVADLQHAWVDALRARGYDVVGDLDELLWSSAPGGVAVSDWVDPDHPDEAQVSDAGVEALRALLVEASRLRASEERLAHDLHEAHRALERAYLRPTYRWREKTVRRLQSSGLGRRALSAYRLARGRSSRSV